MFNRGVRTLVSLLLVFSMLLCSAAMAKTYTIDEAIALIGTEEGRKNNGRVEISDDLSAYNYSTSPDYTLNDGKVLVLYRVGPEKKFSSSDTAFDETYSGVDKGEPKVYLCTGIMENIPEEMRAASLADAGNLLIFDAFYEVSGIITTTSYTEEVTAAKAARGFEQAMQGQAAEEEAIAEDVEIGYKYQPVFNGYIEAALFNTADGSSTSLAENIYPYPELRSNGAAADVATDLFALARCLEACWAMDEMAFYEPCFELFYSENMADDADFENVLNLYSAETVDYAALEAAVTKLIWKHAVTLPALDSEFADMYNQAIAEQNLNGLYYLLNEADYSGVSKSDLEMNLTKAYMGTINLDEMDTMAAEVSAIMDDLGWDIPLLYTILTSEY